MHFLDKLDQRLISVLRVDGRAPVSKLASILDVSRATVQNRLDRLLESGVVLGFTVRAREEHGPDAVQAIMMVEVRGHATAAVIKRLRGLAPLRSLHSTNGKWDLVVQLSAASLPEFDRVLREVRAIDGITNSETSILLSTV